MIVKQSTKADECAAFAAFISSPDFDRMPERARKNALARRGGLEGERATAHILDRHFYNAPNHVLLHDLRLQDGIGGFAQFDHVILSRLSRTATVIEVKNYRGRLSKNEHDEWLVWYEGRRRPIDIPNPLEQARRQREVLRSWLKTRRHDLAFEKIGAFVIIPSECSIDRSKIGADVPIYKADNFIAKWSEFGGVTPFGRLFSSGVTARSMVMIGEQLAGDHQPDERELEEMVGLRPRNSQPHAGSDVDDGTAEIDAVPLPEHEVDVDHQDGPTIDDEPTAAAPPAAVIALPEVTIAPAISAPAVTITSGKASAKIEVIPGIHERALPDGRIAFLADGDEEAGSRLRLACDGLARWNPRYRNWLTDAAQASIIREALLTTHREHVPMQQDASQAPSLHQVQGG